MPFLGYTIIVKADANTFAKYRRVTDLKRFTKFLQKKWKGWRYFNVYDRTTGDQLTSYTKNNPPTTKRARS